MSENSELMRDALEQSQTALGTVYSACNSCQQVLDNTSSLQAKDSSRFDDIRGGLTLIKFYTDKQLENLEDYLNRN